MAQGIEATAAWGFVDAITDAPAKGVSQEAIVTVSRRDQGGKVWVRFDGAVEDTPVAVELQRVSVGERCKVSIHGGRVTIVGNSTSPGVGMGLVDEAIAPTRSAAQTSITMAREAKLAANSAVSDAGIARSAADSAVRDAATANDAAMRAVEDANTAHIAANEAKASALEAKADAAAASASATRANKAATDALTQLSFVEDVAGTLDWIQSHGTFEATSDTEVQEGTVYFELSQGEYVPVIPDGDEDPSDEGWYVLDTSQSQSDYIMAHLAVTSAGLWVLPSGIGNAQTPQQAAGYKVLLSSSGMYLYDGTGHLVTTYGESITFDSSRPQTIGGENAYIAYYDTNDDGVPDSIYIGGSNVSIGGKSASQLLTSLDVSATQTASGADITVNGTTVSLTNGAQGPQGATGPTGPTGPQGDAGVGIASIVEQWYLSTSDQTPTGGSWSSDQPRWASGYHIWSRSLITWDDGTTDTTTPFLATALNGASADASNALAVAEDAAEATKAKANDDALQSYAASMAEYMAENATAWEEAHSTFLTDAALEGYVTTTDYSSDLQRTYDEISARVTKEEITVSPDGGETYEWRWSTEIRESAESISSTLSQTYAKSEDVNGALEGKVDSSDFIELSNTVDRNASEIDEVYRATGQLSTMIRRYREGVLVGRVGQTVGALVNSDGSFDVVPITWSDDEEPQPTPGDPITTIGAYLSRFGEASGFNIAIETVDQGLDTEYRRLAFYDASGDDGGSALVAYMTGGMLYVENSMVLSTMRIGDDDPTTESDDGWEWVYQSDKNLTLRWRG